VRVLIDRFTIGSRAVRNVGLGGLEPSEIIAVTLFKDKDALPRISDQDVAFEIVDVDDSISTFAGGGPPDQLETDGDGGLATNAILISPWDIAFDNDGNAIIVDADTCLIWRVDQDGVIRIIAGQLYAFDYLGDGGPATEASFSFPTGVDVGPDGSVNIADQGNHVVRRIAPDGIVTTVAGTGLTDGFGGDGALATLALLDNPSDVLATSDGSLFISDTRNGVVRQVLPSGVIISAVVLPTGAQPVGLAHNTDEDLYIADQGRDVVVRRDRQTLALETIAGIAGQPCDLPFFRTGDGGPATAATLCNPVYVAVGDDGTVYFSEESANRIRQVTPDGVIVTHTNTHSSSGTDGDGGPSAFARIDTPEGLAVGPDGRVYMATVFSNRVRVAGPNLEANPHLSPQRLRLIQRADAPDEFFQVKETEAEPVPKVRGLDQLRQPMSGFPVRWEPVDDGSGASENPVSATGDPGAWMLGTGTLQRLRAVPLEADAVTNHRDARNVVYTVRDVRDVECVKPGVQHQSPDPLLCCDGFEPGTRFCQTINDQEFCQFTCGGDRGAFEEP
jgi:streptogramin lyase